MPSSAPRGRVLFGTQGWSYDQWQGWLYPPKTPPKDRLRHYARYFDVAEIDSSYYRIPSPQTVATWLDQIPDAFLMAPKVPGEITTGRQPGPRRPADGAARVALRPMAGPRVLALMEEFLRVVRLLGPHLGPIVFQLSPSFQYPTHFDALTTMLEALPALGGEGLDFCVEFRNPSWLTREEPAALLAAHDVAWVWNDWEPATSAERWAKPMPRATDDPRAARVTSTRLQYVRLVGNHDADVDYRTISIDRGEDLAKWAQLVLQFRRERESQGIYVLLNNHYAGCSPETVRQLQRLMGLPVVTFGDDHSAAQPSPRSPHDPTQLALL
ncbi:MAG TPA: DUF72 domain-containing protein [Chloroflexota bacterium]|nr:DUF72 domain-containing protein [Chloroflexota bacterium]